MYLWAHQKFLENFRGLMIEYLSWSLMWSQTKLHVREDDLKIRAAFIQYWRCNCYLLCLVWLQHSQRSKGRSSLNAWQFLFGWFREFGIGGWGRRWWRKVRPCSWSSTEDASSRRSSYRSRNQARPVPTGAAPVPAQNRKGRGGDLIADRAVSSLYNKRKSHTCINMW